MTHGVTKPTRGEWVAALIAVFILGSMLVSAWQGWI